MKQTFNLRVISVFLIVALFYGLATFDDTSIQAAPRNLSWGITIHAAPFPNLHQEQRFRDLAEEQIFWLKELGVKKVRLIYPMETPSRARWLVERLTEEGFEPVVIIEDYLKGPQPNEFEHGLNLGRDVVGNIGGRVDYYQLANEIGGSAIKGSDFHGATLDQYDEDKLNQTLEFISGVSEAIALDDTGAKRIVSINSTHTGIIEEAIKRGIGFEIIGWNWFSDFGIALNKPLPGQPRRRRTTFIQKLKSFKKELWLTEISRREGVTDGNEGAQADFLKKAIPVGVKNGFTGFFPFLLNEDVVNLPGYGLVQPVENPDGRWSIDRGRTAFGTYKELIQNKGEIKKAPVKRLRRRR